MTLAIFYLAYYSGSPRAFSLLLSVLLCVLICGAGTDSILFDSGFAIQCCFENFFSIVADWCEGFIIIPAFYSYFNLIYLLTCSI